MEISDLPCDLDMYILDDSCSPNTGCVDGSTQSFNASDTVEFECTAGNAYYVVVEAYGTNHLDVASGPCTDDGTSTGNVISPTYTLSFDVSQSTGCAEDCDNGLDDDLDGLTDCLDDDGDGVSEEEGDCDDTNANISPNTQEIPDNGIDDDCDGEIDEVAETNDIVDGNENEKTKGCSTQSTWIPLWGLVSLLFVRRRKTLTNQ